jgi:hypothetical protein
MISIQEWLEKNNKSLESLDDSDYIEICFACSLDKDFIIKYSDKLSWKHISMYQRLDEEFIREFADKVNWSWICITQKLSENFIREFADKVDWEHWEIFSSNQKLSEEFILEFKEKISFRYLIPCFYSENLQKEVPSSWRYKKL